MLSLISIFSHQIQKKIPNGERGQNQTLKSNNVIDIKLEHFSGLYPV